MTVTTMPDLPLTCLSSAEFKRTTEVLEGQNTVIGEQNMGDSWLITILGKKAQQVSLSNRERSFYLIC